MQNKSIDFLFVLVILAHMPLCILADPQCLEEAKVQDDTIVIDTTKQRIVTKDDLSYDVKVFENVEIIRNEEEPDAEEKRELTAKGVVEAVGSFFNGIKTKIGEAMVENEGSISGTEYQPETGH